MGYITYDDWGALTSKQVLRTNQRELDLVQQYTVHPYDQVLGVYFAQARMYDAADRRFMAVDLVKGWISEPATLVQYVYALDNPILFIDLNGREAVPTVNGVPIMSAWGDNSITFANLSEIFDAVGVKYGSYYDTAYGYRDYTQNYRYAYYYVNEKTHISFRFNNNKLTYTSAKSSGELSYLEIVPGKLWKSDVGREFDIIVNLDYFCKIFCDNGVKATIGVAHIVTKADLIALKWRKVTDEMVSDLNRVQIKYNILSIESVRHFLGQCGYETSNGGNLHEGSNRYLGGGYMQITHNYNYAAFAIYLALEKHPELATYGVKYLTPTIHFYDNPKEKPERLIKNMYEKLISVAKANKIDISEFTSIFERGHYTVSEKYKWESAGWYWKDRGISEKIDDDLRNKKTELVISNNVSELVNPGAKRDTGKEKERTRYSCYLETKKVIK